MTSCSSCFTHSQTITLLIVSLFLTLCRTSLHLLCQALLTINPGKSSHRPLSKQNTHLSCTSMYWTEDIGYNHKNQSATSWKRTCSFGTEAEMMRLFLSFKMTKHGKLDINGLARALLHISCDYAGFRQNVFRALTAQMTQRGRKMWARIFMMKCPAVNTHSSALTKVLECSPLVFVLGMNTNCTGLIIWFLSTSRLLAQKTVCTLPRCLKQ